ncbi:MAG: glucosaminidase domain-containing protein [Mariprofundales bacterium]
MRNLACPTLLILLFSISGCVKPVTFHSAPEERAISDRPTTTNHQKKQSWRPTEGTSAYPFTDKEPQKSTSIPDFSAIKGANNRKQRFLKWLQPIAQRENLRIIQQRKQLLKLQGRSLNQRDNRFLTKLANSYGLTKKHYSDRHFIALLLLRVDEVPTDLILAQAAIESAWGKSRFAREGNNLFGEWCFHQGCGMVPRQRSAGASHEVRFFHSPTLSVRAYLHNINTGKTYKLLRQLRHKERQLHQPLSGYELALGLRSYSERGMEYVRLIRHIIKKSAQK